MQYEEFKDAFDRAWEVVATPWEQSEIQTRLGVNIYDVVDHTPLETDDKSTVSARFMAKLETDDLMLANILWILCESQANDRTVSHKDFIRGVSGEALDRAFIALLGALANFFRRPEQRLFVRRITEAFTSLKQEQSKRVVEGIENGTKAFDPAKFLDEHLNSQRSQESTRDPQQV